MPNCSESCLAMAERMDCSVPSCQVWLDNVCPTKQVQVNREWNYILASRFIVIIIGM